MLRRALEIREKVPGPGHPVTLSSVNSLWLVLLNSAEYDEPKAMHRRALEVKEKVQEPKTPYTLVSVSSID